MLEFSNIHVAGCQVRYVAMGHVNYFNFSGRVHSFNGSKPPCLVPIIDKQRMNPFDAVTFGSVNDT